MVGEFRGSALQLVHIFRFTHDEAKRCRFNYQHKEARIVRATPSSISRESLRFFPPPPKSKAKKELNQGQKENKCENYLGLLYPVEVYIPFNPLASGDERGDCLTEISVKTGEIFYILPSIDPSLQHVLDSGETIPLYRWAQRRWLFSRFDEGIQLTQEGFTDVTPEPVAQHMAKQMLAFLTTGDQPKDTGDEKVVHEASSTAETVEPMGATLPKNDAERYPSEKDSGLVAPCASPQKKLDQDPLVSSLPSPSTQPLQSNDLDPRSDKSFPVSKEKKVCDGEPNAPESLLVGNAQVKTPKELCVIEACCGFGGNTIQLALLFHHVLAIERDMKRVEMAKSNAKVYGLKNIDFFNEDFETWYAREKEKWIHHKADWFFASPPWGGQDYKEAPVFSFDREICGCHLTEMAVLGSKIARNVGVYLPSNQDLAELIYLAAKMEGTHLIYLENISIGLKKKIKFRVVYFLEFHLARKIIPDLVTRLGYLYTLRLEEKPPMQQWMVWLLNHLGIESMLHCLKISILEHSCYETNSSSSSAPPRTRGGTFFATIKKLFPNVYRDLNKTRKKNKIKKLS